MVPNQYAENGENMPKRIYKEKQYPLPVKITIARAQIDKLENDIAFEENHITTMETKLGDMKLPLGSNEQHIKNSMARLTSMRKELAQKREQLAKLLSERDGVNIP